MSPDYILRVTHPTLRSPLEESAMQYEEFIGHVRKRARSVSMDEAERAAQATLETLGERLTKQEREDLAEQLPGKLKGYLFRQEAGQPLKLDEFFEEVSFRGGIDRPKAVKMTRAVLTTLRQAVSPGEIEDVLSQLPKDYHALFGEEQEA
jgi:uncharacterized protein (DUF2267 family)